MSLMFQAINTCKKPVIGKIHGAALGGGVGLVAVCDYVIAENETILGLTEVNLGLVPAVISPFVFAKMGMSNARAYFSSGKKFKALVAKELGLVHEVVGAYELEAAVDRMIAEYLKAGPHAVEIAKSLVFENLKYENNQKEITHLTCDTIAKARVSAEGQEGMSALLEKRSPKWS
jgi:methylglutaconyl-CoA hydratase